MFSRNYNKEVSPVRTVRTAIRKESRNVRVRLYVKKNDALQCTVRTVRTAIGEWEGE